MPAKHKLATFPACGIGKNEYSRKAKIPHLLLQDSYNSNGHTKVNYKPRDLNSLTGWKHNDFDCDKKAVHLFSSDEVQEVDTASKIIEPALISNVPRSHDKNQEVGPVKIVTDVCDTKVESVAVTSSEVVEGVTLSVVDKSDNKGPDTKSGLAFSSEKETKLEEGTSFSMADVSVLGRQEGNVACTSSVESENCGHAKVPNVKSVYKVTDNFVVVPSSIMKANDMHKSTDQVSEVEHDPDVYNSPKFYIRSTSCNGVPQVEADSIDTKETKSVDDNDGDAVILEILPTPNQTLGGLSDARSAEKPATVANESENLELCTGNLVSCIYEDVEPGREIAPDSQVTDLGNAWELCSSEIEPLRQLYVTHFSEATHVECGPSGISEEAAEGTEPSKIDHVIIKSNPSGHEPASGGTIESDISSKALYVDQELRENEQVEDTKELSDSTEPNVYERGQTLDPDASENVFLGVHSHLKGKVRKSHSSINMSSQRKKSNISVLDKKYKRTKRSKGKSDGPAEPADKQESNMHITSSEFTGLKLQPVDETGPSHLIHSSLNDAAPTSFGVPAVGIPLCDVSGSSVSSDVQHKIGTYTWIICVN